jgi:hypothetical protein
VMQQWLAGTGRLPLFARAALHPVCWFAGSIGSPTGEFCVQWILSYRYVFVCTKIGSMVAALVKFCFVIDGWDPTIDTMLDEQFLLFVSRAVKKWRCGLNVGLMVMVAGVFWLQGQVGDGGGAAPAGTRLRERRRRSCVISDQTSHVLS